MFRHSNTARRVPGTKTPRDFPARRPSAHNVLAKAASGQEKQTRMLWTRAASATHCFSHESQPDITQLRKRPVVKRTPNKTTAQKSEAPRLLGRGAFDSHDW